MASDEDFIAHAVSYIHKETNLSIEVITKVINSLNSLPSPDLENSAVVSQSTKSPIELPEFRVRLTRLQNDELLDPPDLGQRSKFGGSPTRIHDAVPWPTCPHCHSSLTFVAQIDSVEHHCTQNPHSVDSLSVDQKWMFGDVGMIYVYYCFDCGHTESNTTSY